MECRASPQTTQAQLDRESLNLSVSFYNTIPRVYGFCNSSATGIPVSLFSKIHQCVIRLESTSQVARVSAAMENCSSATHCESSSSTPVDEQTKHDISIGLNGENNSADNGPSSSRAMPFMESTTRVSENWYGTSFTSIFSNPNINNVITADAESLKQRAHLLWPNRVRKITVLVPPLTDLNYLQVPIGGMNKVPVSCERYPQQYEDYMDMAKLAAI